MRKIIVTLTLVIGLLVATTGRAALLDTTSPVGNYECNKPIDQLTMIWTGSENVSVEAWKGSVGSTSLGVQSVAPGAEISFSGFAGSPNDVFWEVNDGMGTLLGESKFHLSCSNGDMNGPEDCGKAQGNGKDNNGSLINLWQLEGIVDAEATLNCTPQVWFNCQVKSRLIAGFFLPVSRP